MEVEDSRFIAVLAQELGEPEVGNVDIAVRPDQDVRGFKSRWMIRLSCAL
jgi:hypothetical protein